MGNFWIKPEVRIDLNNSYLSKSIYKIVQDGLKQGKIGGDLKWHIIEKGRELLQNLSDDGHIDSFGWSASYANLRHSMTLTYTKNGVVHNLKWTSTISPLCEDE